MSSQMSDFFNSKLFLVALTSIIASGATYLALEGNVQQLPPAVQEKAKEVKAAVQHEAPKAAAVAEPAEPNGEPEDWSKTEMFAFLHKHGIESTHHETRAELLGRVESVMHQPKM